MVWGARSGGDAVPAGGDVALPVGARVWLLPQACGGRVVARAHGGLVYRVRREGAAGAVLVCPGSDLLRLHDETRE